MDVNAQREASRSDRPLSTTLSIVHSVLTASFWCVAVLLLHFYNVVELLCTYIAGAAKVHMSRSVPCLFCTRRASYITVQRSTLYFDRNPHRCATLVSPQQAAITPTAIPLMRIEPQESPPGWDQRGTTASPTLTGRRPTDSSLREPVVSHSAPGSSTTQNFRKCIDSWTPMQATVRNTLHVRLQHPASQEPLLDPPTILSVDRHRLARLGRS